MALSLADALPGSFPGAPPNLKEAVEAAHARLHYTRCQSWMAASGHRPSDPYKVLLNLRGQIPTVKVADPRPWLGCEFHPVVDP